MDLFSKNGGLKNMEVHSVNLLVGQKLIRILTSHFLEEDLDTKCPELVKNGS